MDSSSNQFDGTSQLENPYASGEARATTIEPLRSRNLTPFLVANIILHLIVWVLIGVVVPGPKEQLGWLGWAFGMASGQIVLCATFVALANNSLWLRITAMIITLAGITTVFSFYVVRTNGPLIIGMMIGLFYLVQFLVVAGVLGLISRTTRCQLLMSSRRGSADRIVQFRIQHLFIATLVIAVIFGLGRLIPFGDIDTFIPLKIVYLLGSVNVFSVILSLPIVFSCLVTKNSAAWIAGSVVLAVFVCAIHIFVNAEAVPNISASADKYLFAVAMDAATMATILFCMLPLKFAGLRFGREE